jgi:hypothetical protein
MEPAEVIIPIKLSPRPLLNLTDEDVRALLKFDPRITGIIFDNQADWFAAYDEALAMQKTYDKYVTRGFGGDKKEK